MRNVGRCRAVLGNFARRAVLAAALGSPQAAAQVAFHAGDDPLVSAPAHGHPTVSRAVPQRRSWLSPRLTEEERIRGLLYVSYAGYDEVLIYTRSIPNQLIGELYEGLCVPAGLAVDARHRLYVASSLGECLSSPSVAIFQQGVAAPGKTITDGLYSAFAIAVSAKDGTIYTTDTTGGNVVEYAPGRTTVKNIVYPLGARLFAIALDQNDVLYAVYYDQSIFQARVGRYDPVLRTFVDTGIPLGTVGPITFDRQNNLLVSDGRTGIISVYHPGSTAPFKTYGKFPGAFAMTLDAENTILYVTNPGDRTVDELSYPDGQKLGEIRGFAYNTFGVAVTSPTMREGH